MEKLQFEVLVIADDCQDDTAEKVTEFASQAPYDIRLYIHAARNAASTRNLGAENAQGKILLFLDDDVIPQPGLIKTHLDAQHPDRVVLGYSKPIYPHPASLWQKNARLWWEDMYGEMRRPGHRFSYRDFFSGNVSMVADFFRRIGGFDERIRGRLEDYEFGMRLLAAGAQFHFAPDALAYHYDDTDLDLWLRRSHLEGIADVQIVRIHPQLMTERFSNLNDRQTWSRVRQTVRHFAIGAGKMTDWFAVKLLDLAKLGERMKLRRLWWFATGFLREYHYWRGVAYELGSRKAAKDWIRSSPKPPKAGNYAPIIDLAETIDAYRLRTAFLQAEQSGLKVYWRGSEVFQIPPQPGKEPLREDHLWGALWEKAAEGFLPALAIDLIRTGEEKGTLWQASTTN